VGDLVYFARMTTIRRFMEDHFLHFNARETLAAARAWEAHLAAGGRMLVTLAVR